MRHYMTLSLSEMKEYKIIQRTMTELNDFAKTP